MFLRGVYGWMGLGLAVTALTAWLIAGSPALVTAIATNRALFWGLMIAQPWHRLRAVRRAWTGCPASTASLLFIAYSALTGLTLSFVLLAYTGESVTTTFLVTAGTFGALAAYGTTTRRSLARIRTVSVHGSHRRRTFGIRRRRCSGTVMPCNS